MKPTNSKPKTSTKLLKWSGSKIRQADQICNLIGPVDQYAEPFFGSGAVFFEMARRKAFSHATLCDANKELIRFWRAVQSDPIGLSQKIQALPKSNPNAVYLELRAEFNETGAPELLVWLNKSCFNGLYRVNKKGRFNTSHGTVRDPLPLPSLDQIVSASKALARADLLHCTMEHPDAWAADVVYCDPPYVPLPGKKSFVAYVADGFPAHLQTDLIELAEQSRARVLISNSYTARPLFDLAKWKIHEITERRSMAGKASARGNVAEVLAVNESSDRPI